MLMPQCIQSHIYLFNEWYATSFFGQMVEFIFSGLSNFEFLPHVGRCGFTLSFNTEISHCRHSITQTSMKTTRVADWAQIFNVTLQVCLLLQN